MSFFKSFKKNEHANVGVMFAAAIVPVMISIGAAIDYSRLTSAQSELQQAADAAALSGALALMKDGQQEMEDVSKNVYIANSEGIPGLEIEGYDIADTNSGTVMVKSTAKLEPMFMQIFDFPRLDISVISEATLASPGGLEIALALDATYSMNFDSRWDTTMQIMENTLNDMQAFTGNSNFNITLVPFGDSINIGPSRANWLDSPAPADWTHCVNAREKHMGSLQWALDDTNPRTEPFPVKPTYDPSPWGEFNCPNVSITGPTNNVEQIIQTMRTITSRGTGRLDAAMAWSWRILSPKWKGFWTDGTYPADYTDNTRKKIIYASDGNTEIYTHQMSQERSWAYNQGSIVAFEHMVDLCSRIKSEGIEIYMIKIVGNPHAAPYFEQCASSANHYYNIVEPTDLSLVFNDIVNEFHAELRIMR